MTITYKGKTTLSRLSAYDKYLWSGEKLVILRFAACVVLPILLCILRLWLYVSVFYCNALIIYCAGACILWKLMESRIASNRRNAARMLQLAECDLFGIRWNKYLCGEEILPEDVFFNNRHELEHYKGFFPEKLEGLSQKVAYLIYVKYCIESYRKKSHKYLNLSVWGAGAFIVAMVVMAALIPAVNFNGFLFYAVVTSVPVVVWVSSVVDSSKRGEKQLSVIENMIEDSENEDFTDKWKDLMQDYMFLYREQEYLVPRFLLK